MKDIGSYALWYVANSGFFLPNTETKRWSNSMSLIKNDLCWNDFPKRWREACVMNNDQQRVFPTIKSDPRWLAASLASLVAVNQVTVMVASQINLMLLVQIIKCMGCLNKNICMPIGGFNALKFESWRIKLPRGMEQHETNNYSTHNSWTSANLQDVAHEMKGRPWQMRVS